METEKIKILEKVIERNDYERLSCNLAETAKRFAEIIRKKMTQLEIEEIIIKGLILKNKQMKTNSGFSIKFLCDEFGKSFEAMGNFYFANDFNCYVRATTSKEKLRFINRLIDILNYLDERETQKTKEIEDALEKVSSI